MIYKGPFQPKSFKRQITKSRFSSVDTKIAYYIFCKDILRYEDLLCRSLELPHASWEPTCGAQEPRSSIWVTLKYWTFSSP